MSTRRSPRRGGPRWLAALAVPSGLVLVLWMTGCMERLFYLPTAGPTPVPDEHPLAEAVTFASADGTRLSGWFIPARGAEAGERRATVIHVHGNAGNIESHLWFSEFLPAAGLNLFLFDYRGYGESAGSARHRDDLIADAEAALDAMLARPDVDPDRIGLFAQSLGGGIGLNLMAERPEIRAAVVVSAFASWRDIAADAVGGGDAGAVSRFLASILIKDHRRPLDAIARIDRPLLLVHGDADSVVPITHGRRLAEAGPTAELLEVRGGGHNALRETDPWLDQVCVEFYRRHLGLE